jgi:UDP-N-acetyl-D-glucosamine dehydrogenase
LDIDTLCSRLTAREATVGVIGLGYVGLPLAIAMARAGFSVLGLDVDELKVRALNAGRSYIHHIAGELITELRASGRFEANDDFARLDELDAVLICVPTPLSRHREPDLTFVEQTAEAIARHLRPG